MKLVTTMNKDFPYIVYLTNNGTLHFDDDYSVENIERLQKISVDLWILNNQCQYQEIQECFRIFLKNNCAEKITKAKFGNLKPGTQVIYVPDHLITNDRKILFYDDLEFGFVTSKKKAKDGSMTIFCRYFNNFNLSLLRTMSCSETVSIQNLFVFNSFDPDFIKEWMKYIISTKIEDDRFYLSLNNMRMPR